MRRNSVLVTHRGLRIKIKTEKKLYHPFFIGAELEVTVKLHDRYLLACSAVSDPENVNISVGTAALELIVNNTGTSS